jgi:hypothetical protein
VAPGLAWGGTRWSLQKKTAAEYDRETWCEVVELYCRVTIGYNPNPGSSFPMPPHWTDQSQGPHWADQSQSRPSAMRRTLTSTSASTTPVGQRPIAAPVPRRDLSPRLIGRRVLSVPPPPHPRGGGRRVAACGGGRRRADPPPPAPPHAAGRMEPLEADEPMVHAVTQGPPGG